MKEKYTAKQKLACKIARKFQGSGVSDEDLEQEALLVLLEQENNWTADLGISFNTFLYRKISDRLRPICRSQLGLKEIARHWIAEAVSGDPAESIKSPTWEQCEATRQHKGRDKFKKPKRAIEYAKVFEYMDAPREPEGTVVDHQYTGDEPINSLHEALGQGANQEFDLMRTQISKEIADASEKGFGRKNQAPDLQRIAQLRSRGSSFREIGEELGKSEASVRQRWYRARACLNKT